MCVFEGSNQLNKKCYYLGIIFSSIFIIAFQTIIVALIKNLINPENIKSFILSEKPLYNFEISERDIANKKNITFFEFKGRKRKEGNTTITYDKKSFTKIFQNKFFYEESDKNYFDYINKYSVESGNNCPDNYKKCGILDSSKRILCLPEDDQCPLNGFGISDSESDTQYNGYESKKVYDSIDNSIYYLYYTNKNTNGDIITEFKLSDGIPCAEISEINWINYYDNEIEKFYGCKTLVDGEIISYRYSQVSYGVINMISLYKDNGLTDPPSYDYINDAKVFLFVRNYNEIDQKCFEDFFENFEKEKKYYDSILSVVRVLGAISIAFILVTFIYMISICCCSLIFYSISFVSPIYGIICNIIIIALINKERIRYKCHLKGFDKEIEELIDNQYNNNTINIAMSSLSLAFYIFVLIFELCLKFSKRGNEPISRTTVVVQPLYPPGYQTPNGSNMAYSNMMVPPGSYRIPYS